MVFNRTARVALVAVALAACACPLQALVNPSLQPRDIFERHDVVLVLRVTEINEETRTTSLGVVDCPKGKFEPRKVTLSVEPDGPTEAFETLLSPGQCVVAYFGKASGRGAGVITFYAAGGHWGLAQQKSDDVWTWTESLGPLDEKSMFGTFNGDGERLAEMMRDTAAGTVFFPATPFEQFDKDVVLAKLDQPATAVAARDLDGDGRCDVLAAWSGGVRALVQTKPLVFEDKTQALGLAAAKGRSVSAADANADGRCDLLIGAELYISGSGSYARSDALTIPDPQNVIMATFVDLNADGWPDVLVSRAGGGLGAYLNPGKAQGAFTDATKDLGLDAPKIAGGNGYVFPGDLNGDGKIDLYYSTGDGLLLLRGTSGFAPSGRMRFDLSISDGSEGLTGGGCIAPLWRADSSDLVLASYAAVNFAIFRDGKLVDASGWANEITESELGLAGVLAEDLNADGNVDVYALNRGGFANVFYTNRGYGSFMTPHKYAKGQFPGAAHNKGSGAGAAADIDGDGANDLVLAAGDGSVCLMRNATLATRRKQPTPTWHQRILDQTSIVSVKVQGPLGVLGASVTLTDAAGKVVMRRVVGAGDMPGCRGDDTLNLALRQMGKYSVQVVYSDGAKAGREVDLTKPAQHVETTVTREMAASVPAGSAKTGEGK